MRAAVAAGWGVRAEEMAVAAKAGATRVAVARAATAVEVAARAAKVAAVSPGARAEHRPWWRAPH